MRILLPYDINQNASNKFLYYFYDSLKKEKIDIKASSLEWKKKSTLFDAVIIHWPEHLPNCSFKYEKDFINYSLERIDHFSKYSKIFYIVHNIKPHFNFSNNLINIFNAVIKNSTAIFHFSNFSRDLFINSGFNKHHNYIVPHGNYSQLIKKEINNIEFIKNFNLNNKKTTVSVIGAVRNKKEFKIIFNFAKEYLNANCNFIYSGSLVEDFQISGLNNFTNKLKKIFYHKLQFTKLVKIWRGYKLKSLGKSIIIFPNKINDHELIKICNLTDIIIIPRYDSLNSGNVALGFTFACYVVGPNIGNIGQILVNRNNLTFDVPNIKFKKIVNQSINLINNKIKKQNKEIALEEWNWSKLAKNYKSVFLKYNEIN